MLDQQDNYDFDAGDVLVHAPGDDPSRLVEFRQRFIDIPEFEMALALYTELNGVSRKDWDKIREILFLLKNENGDPLPQVVALPKQLSTLKDRLASRLPRINMREYDVPVNVLKIPTLPATLKPEERAKLEEYRENITRWEQAQQPQGRRRGRRAAVPKPDFELPKVTHKLTYFDPPSVVKTFICSDIHQKAHRGPAIFVDTHLETEFFHSHAWASSVRTTCGQYAHIYINGAGDPTAAVFPGDFIYYRCLKPGCFCHDIEDDTDDTGDLHIGRVYGVGLETRESSPTFNFAGPGRLTLQIQEGLREDHPTLRPFHINPDHLEDELILTSELTCIPESKVFSHVDVFVDWAFDETHEDPADFAVLRRQPLSRRAPKKFPKYYEPGKLMKKQTEEQWYHVRRLFKVDEEKMIPMCHTHRLRAELEIEEYGRAVYEDQWDAINPENLPVESFPMVIFIDGFGVFRNSYRSLMGMYFTPAALTLEERLRPRNMFPLVLGPHASEFGDVLAGLRTLADLESDQVMGINGQDSRVCAFAMCYTGDMPAQAENSGFKGPRGKKFCRCCYAVSGQKAEDPELLLRFDHITHGRFHNQTREMQVMMLGITSRQTVQSHADEYGTQWGIQNPEPPLAKISPAADLILTRPADGAHSEYQGLSGMMHMLLRDGLLAPNCRGEYAVQLRSWKFPPGWQRLQSPIHHLASYTLSEHARWSIVVPGLLRHWLRRFHLNPVFVGNFERRSAEDPADYIVRACAMIAKSNSVLMGRQVSQEDRANMADIIFTARSRFNQLCHFASQVNSAAPTPAQSRAGTPAAAGDVANAAGDEIRSGSVSATTATKVEFLNDTVKPNTHFGIHYPMFAEEYGLIAGLSTLTGEDLHR